MRKLLLSIFSFVSIVNSYGQAITITANDMPVSGDSLRYSYVSPIGGTIDITTTGANTTWNYSALVPVTQALDVYKLALQVNILYAIISPAAYGYKIADSLPGASSLPVPINEIYNFFSKKNNPSRFVAEAFAAKIAGTPIPINYSDEDEWYIFPLDYTDVDSSTFRLSYNFTGLGSFSQQGKRKATVDGWGTITTPHFTTPQNCLRVRSEIQEVDTFTIQSVSTPIARHTVEYKWLANGEHYPILWITTTVVGGQETVSAVRFRDHYRHSLGINNVSAAIQELKAYPNPASDMVTIDIPKAWTNYSVELFDVQGKLVATTQNKSEVNISNLNRGHYIVRVTSGDNIGYVRLVK